jgi:predicted GNAT family N-acyltransferase
VSRVKVERVQTPAEVAAAYAVRHEVFVVGQGVPIMIERDELDPSAHHVLARVDGAAVGAGRLVITRDAPDSAAAGAPVGVLGRLAVLPAARGEGLGDRLVAVIEQLAVEHGCRVLELHAQVPVRGFYERLGYHAFGEEYEEAGIPHISMRKMLPETSKIG